MYNYDYKFIDKWRMSLKIRKHNMHVAIYIWPLKSNIYIMITNTIQPEFLASLIIGDLL